MDRKIITRILMCLGILLFMAIFCLAVMKSHGKKGELQITMLDVGQGDATLILQGYLDLKRGKNE